MKRDFQYECLKCGISFIETRVPDEEESYRAPRACPECEGTSMYKRCLPLKMNLASKVAFERNGVKGYVIKDGQGGVQYRAASKDHWMDTGEVKPQYTPAYENHLRKTGQSHMLQQTDAGEIMEKRKKNKQLSKEFDQRLAAAKDSHLRGEE